MYSKIEIVVKLFAIELFCLFYNDYPIYDFLKMGISAPDVKGYDYHKNHIRIL